MLTAAELPNDINALKALLLARDEQIVGLQAQLNTRAAEIEHLKLWGPVLDNEPAPEVLDAVLVSAEGLIDQAVSMAPVNSAPSAAAATAVAQPRFASSMQNVTAIPAVGFPNMYLPLLSAARVDGLAFSPPVAERPEPNVPGIVVDVDQPAPAVDAKPVDQAPPSTVTLDSPAPDILKPDAAAPHTPVPTSGPQAVAPVAVPSAPTQIPEPGSAALIGLALIVLAPLRHRSKKACHDS